MEDFVTFELAKKLKEKGYPQRTFGEYDMQGACYIEDGRFYENGCITEVARAYTSPTIYQVMKWLRNEKNIHITILVITDFSTDADNNICEEWSFWSFYVTNLNDGSTIYDDCERIDSIEYQSYEESAIAGIEYVLDNLI